jgi:hypothetical protein
MSIDRFEEWTKSKKHIRGTLHPIVQYYTKETTIAVFCLNPVSVLAKPPERVFEILRARGYTRLYVLYLFSRIGDFSELSNMPIDELIHQRCDEVIEEIIPDVSKVFFAYGEPPSKDAAWIINERATTVKNIILKIKPGEPILKFGELSRDGNPKSLRDLQSDDIESEF